MGSDAYLRLRTPGPPQVGTVPTALGALVFVDVEPEPPDDQGDSWAYLLKQLTEVPPGFFLQASIILFRLPEFENRSETLQSEKDDAGRSSHVPEDLSVQADALRQLLHSRVPRRPDIGIARFRIGKPPEITWSTGHRPVEDDAFILRRARDAELRTLLAWGNAIWEPVDYHYVLPSGEHSSVFIRLADAFRQPRDIAAIATWVFEHLTDDLTIVVDSATMLPLVSAIEVAMAKEGLSGLQSIFLADYQLNHYELEALMSSAADAENVLALISVSSTGATVRHMAGALDRRQQPYVVETLVSRSCNRNFQALTAQRAIASPWTELGIEAETYQNSDSCALCRQPERSRHIYVDPRSFVPMVLPRPDLMVPAVHQARHNRDLWQCYDRTTGAGIHAKPHQTTQEFRHGRTRLAVRCFPHWILDRNRYAAGASSTAGQLGSYDNFCESISARVGQIALDISADEQTRDPRSAFVPSEVDLVVVSEADRSATGFDCFIELVRMAFGVSDAPTIVAVSPPYSDMTSLAQDISGKHHILVVALGALTGTSMQQMLVGLHSQIQPKDGVPPQIAGLVMHARYEDRREWTVLKNAYTRLHSIWATPLSLGSPFESEAVLLDLVARPDDGGREFYDQRLKFLNGLDPDWENRIQPRGSEVDPWAVFWGMPLRLSGTWKGKEAPRLRPGSFFGHELNAVCTFAAVGSAVQEARIVARASTAPSFRQFEMPAILRSYFDAPIIASIVRWMEPHEAWWGDRPSDAANVLAELFARAGSAETKILLPEFLLAAALGKVSTSGLRWLKARAEHCVWCCEHGVATHQGSSPWSKAEIAPVQLGLGLVRHGARTNDDHFARVEEKLKEALSRVEATRLDKGADRSSASLATSYLLWALETYLD